MRELDPEEEAPVVQDGASVDASKPGLQKDWERWTSSPANNSALIQFGIAMLQPRGPGQSGIGSVANAVAEGGGAIGRVTAAQKAEEATAQAQAESDSKIALQGKQGDATVTNANAYRDAVAGAGSGGVGAKAALLAQRSFNTWINKPEDTTGLTRDPVFKAIQRQFPKLASKDELLNNPEAMAAARRLYQTVDPEATGGGDPSAAGLPSPAAPVASQGRPVYDKATGKILRYVQ